MVKTKNHDFILDIASLLPEAKFVIIGNGELEQELKNKRALKGLDNVLLPGMKENANDYYNAFDAFILPSLYEGLPMTGVEAEINNLYVVFSTNVSHEALITGYGSFLPIEKEDAISWANLLKEKHERKDNHEALRKAGYDIKEAGKTLIDIYRELLK